jgi:DNA processing protein
LNTDTPIAEREELIAALTLAMLPGVGPQLQQALLNRFGSAREALAASRATLRTVPGLGEQVGARIAAANPDMAREEIALCQSHEIDILLASDTRLPRQLQEIACPPALLFARGDVTQRDALSIAIVGTRHATTYGRRIARRLASSLASAGLTIVSGLARGIDAAAHEGALEAGGRTLAVLAGGLHHVYPTEHKELAFDISQQGALLSEFPCDWPIQRGAFPRRNRIITGLSLGVIVVEAGERSGALISARHAMEQDREVFAVPGPVDSRASRGCHALLRDGAVLVESADDVFEALGPLAEITHRATGEEVHHPAELQLNEQEQQVLACIASHPTGIDEITVASGLPIQRVLATVSVLETRRLVRRISGQQLVRL